MQLNIAGAALIVGFVIGLTGMGGGALMTPVLVILFGVNPTAAISSVGLTSVGSGSLMIVMLMFLYPKLSAREMVGTDLVQAIPLVASAAIGHLIFGDLQFGLTSSVLVGAIPGVYVGARVSASARDRFIRPALIAVLTISSLKLVGASNQVLLGTLIVSVVAIATYFVLDARRRREPQSSP